jgi:hypothetical protein
VNSENHPAFHSSALDGHLLRVRPPRFTWTLFVAQLWLLAAYAGMSLVAIATKLFFGGDGQQAAALASALIGAALAVIAWRHVADLYDRAELESIDATTQRESTDPAEQVLPAKSLLLAAHR